MVQTDLDVLLDMGFEKERAEIAVKKTRSRKCLPTSWSMCASGVPRS